MYLLLQSGDLRQDIQVSHSTHFSIYNYKHLQYNNHNNYCLDYYEQMVTISQTLDNGRKQKDQNWECSDSFP